MPEESTSPAPLPHSAVPRPLCVDAEHSLLRSSLWWEVLLAEAGRQPWRLPLYLYWRACGAARFWREAAARTGQTVLLLPIEPEAQRVIRQAHREGQPVVLVTRAPSEAAAWLRLAVPEAAQVDSLFGASPAHRGGLTGEVAHFRRPPGVDRGAALVRQLRVHQWIKNLLVFLPILLSHKWRQAPLWGQAALLFLSFCLAGSAVYCANDLLDLQADRAHPHKRRRPLAAGELPLGLGAALAPLLALAAIVTAWWQSGTTAAWVALYLVAASAYSLWLKRVLLVDVLVLSGLYCLRVLAGGEVNGILISPWTLGFCLFLFLSLALMKRCSELVALDGRSQTTAAGRGYDRRDLPVVLSLGCGSGMVAVLVIALYVNSPDVRILYRRPDLIWVVCPLVGLWIGRLWIMTHRGISTEDPVLFAAKDPWSYGVIAAACVCAALAI